MKDNENTVMTQKLEKGCYALSLSGRDVYKRQLHGLTRTLINNMVIGVTEGYSKKLEIVGVGYRAQKSGKTLTLNLGYSHPITLSLIHI